MRATPVPSWTSCTTVSTAPSSASKAQTAATVASGMPYRRKVSSVMTPSVPSDPTSSRVRS